MLHHSILLQQLYSNNLRFQDWILDKNIVTFDTYILLWMHNLWCRYLLLDIFNGKIFSVVHGVYVIIIESNLFTCRNRSKCNTVFISGLATWSVPSSGMFFWVKLNKIKDSCKMVLEHGVEKDVRIMIRAHAEVWTLFGQFCFLSFPYKILVYAAMLLHPSVNY